MAGVFDFLIGLVKLRVMPKKILVIAIVGFVFAICGKTHAATLIQNGNIAQFNNLVIESVNNPTVPTEIIVTGQTNGTQKTFSCIKYESIIAASGIATECPVPRKLGVETLNVLATYTIRITSDTRLLLRDRSAGTLTQFSAGDQLNIFGAYNQDGILSALTIRNLSKPEVKRTIQMENLYLLRFNRAEGTLIALQAENSPCYEYTGEIKRQTVCPKGLTSFEETDAATNLIIPDFIRTLAPTARKYIIKTDSTTSFVDRNKTPLLPIMVMPPDQLNIYGELDGSARLLNAKVVRNISKPISTQNYRGNITKINSDNSFEIKARDGRTLTVQNPFQVGAAVNLNGVLDETKNYIDRVSDLSIKSDSSSNNTVILAITSINPSSGGIGSRITITGSGFTPTGNSINFGKGFIPNISSLGDSLSFNVPDGLSPACAFPKSGEPACLVPATLTTPGVYDISVLNDNGLSNSITFRVTTGNITRLEFGTYRIPTATVRQSYVGTIYGNGGTGSYNWKITGGSLPPGLTLVPGICIAYPCQTPLTISGIPTALGTYSFTIGLTSGNEASTKDFNIAVFSGSISGSENGLNIGL